MPTASRRGIVQTGENGMNATKNDLGRFCSAIREPDLFGKIFWARLVSSENGTLLTRNTRHSFYELQYVLEGRAVIRVGREEPVTLCKNDFLTVPPNTYHQIVETDETGARLILAFSAQSENDGILSALKSMERCERKTDNGTMRHLVEAMLFKVNTSPNERTIEKMLSAFLYELFDRYGAAAQKKPDVIQLSQNEKRAAEILTVIEEHSGVDITVEQIAERFHFSVRHLNRVFTDATGMSVGKAIDREKLRRVEELAVDPLLSFTEVAALCGFCDEYALGRFFKRNVKVSLSDYRKAAHQKK